MKTITKRLTRLFKAIQEEAEQNEVFRKKLEDLFEGIKPMPVKKEKPQPKLNPLALAINGTLTEASLSDLTEQELKDIIAVYHMNPNRKKLKTREAFVSLILETAYHEATRGDVFLNKDHTKASDENVRLAP